MLRASKETVYDVLVVYHLHGQAGKFTVWANGQMVSKFPYWEIPFGTGAYHFQKSLPLTKKFA